VERVLVAVVREHEHADDPRKHDGDSRVVCHEQGWIGPGGYLLHAFIPARVCTLSEAAFYFL
jgi:hypothetical protein